MDILVPVDDSEPARTALEHAVREHPDASITAIHVVDPSAGMYGEGGVYAYDSLLESKKEQAEELLEDVRERAAEDGVDIETDTVVGRPARAVVDYAVEHDADRIVIGSHGRSGASRVLLGSVAEQVVRRAPVPVTVAR
ncbi:universal stress protein [Salinadaptatus halalkaliphilus]|uniref:Universal stress protein n=1 Tax=Salinadaptatus halalkaliphilus TaxID=2419781 RepID=A0A4S3TTI7_9EURY|nr:universal stress protein [Salinadaptatus halalkaliphilus]THE66825.1 universal stress protein [Salinadaptatus halalkaliphilus]